MNSIKQIFSVKVNSVLMMEIKANETVCNDDLVAWLKNAIDCINNDVRNCRHCQGLTYLHEDYLCSNCEQMKNVIMLNSTKGEPNTGKPEPNLGFS